MDVDSILVSPPNPEKKLSLPQAVLRTVTYSDLFEFPLTQEEIHVGLVAHAASPEKILYALNNGLREYIESSTGYYYLRGRKNLIPARENKKQETLKIIAKNKRILKLLCHFPFVRSVNLSGATAFKNCTRDDDIDLFLIVDPRRTWSVYIAILVLLKILRKRKTFCMNYIYGKRNFLIREHDFFIAHQIANLRPLSGQETYREFFAKNTWVQRYLPQSQVSDGSFFAGTTLENYLQPTVRQAKSKRLLESVFGTTLFDPVEQVTFFLFRRLLSRKLSKLGGSTLLEKDELKLFTNDHRLNVLRKFRQRLENLTSET